MVKQGDIPTNKELLLKILIESAKFVACMTIDGSLVSLSLTTKEIKLAKPWENLKAMVFLGI